ncbi:MAG: GNAT family N-acetyltransferase [Candidatus Thorarchaeota archaeon]
MLVIKQALNNELIEKARAIFNEYANYLGISLDFQNFDEELRNLHEFYAPPEGCILLAFYEQKLVGCVGLRKFQGDICEMKRLYVRSKYRNKKIGYNLCFEVILKAKQIGYKHMRLDTLPIMKEAMNLYSKLGFKEIAPYRLNPIKGSKFYELLL